MAEKLNPGYEQHNAATYRIRLKGRLGAQWTDWFEGMAVEPQENGYTILSGPVADQSALHGLFRKIRDLGIPLVSVDSFESEKEREDIE